MSFSAVNNSCLILFIMFIVCIIILSEESHWWLLLQTFQYIGIISMFLDTILFFFHCSFVLDCIIETPCLLLHRHTYFWKITLIALISKFLKIWCFSWYENIFLFCFCIFGRSITINIRVAMHSLPVACLPFVWHGDAIHFSCQNEMSRPVESA